MVNVQRVTKRRAVPEPEVNPFSLIKVTVNGNDVDARPFRFDSDQAGPNTFRNADGDPVRPVAVSTSCPDCGAGLELDVSGGPPLSFGCPHCSVQPDGFEDLSAGPEPDPFRNPFLEGLLSPGEVDADLVDALAVSPPEGLTVGQRMASNAAVDDAPPPDVDEEDSEA